MASKTASRPRQVHDREPDHEHDESLRFVERLREVLAKFPSV